MPSPEHEALVARLLAQPMPTDLEPPAWRAVYDAALTATPIPDDVAVVPDTLAGVSAEWVSVPPDDTDLTVLYLHGGGYVLGSASGYREFAGRFARASAARVCVLDYRLAPEHPFPAGLDDAVTAYRALLDRGVAAADIVVAGDSAGGGLTLATLFELRDGGLELPGCAVLFSPWLDLTGSGSIDPGAAEDPLVNRQALATMAAWYAGDALTYALVSPLFGDFRGLPPLQIQVGTRELLLDDARRARTRARDCGVTLDYVEAESLIHVWPVLAPDAPESARALARAARFMAAHSNNARPPG